MLLLAACGAGDPRAIVEAYYEAARRGDCVAAAQQATSKFAADLRACQRLRGASEPAEFRVVRQSDREANVLVKPRTSSAVAEWSDSVLLVREAGEWRIDGIDVAV